MEKINSEKFALACVMSSSDKLSISQKMEIYLKAYETSEEQNLKISEKNNQEINDYYKSDDFGF